MSAIAIVFEMLEGTYIKGNMTDDGLVIGKSDIGVMLGSIFAWGGGCRRVLFDNESALDVDGDGAWG